MQIFAIIVLVLAAVSRSTKSDNEIVVKLFHLLFWLLVVNHGLVLAHLVVLVVWVGKLGGGGIVEKGQEVVQEKVVKVPLPLI